MIALGIYQSSHHASSVFFKHLMDFVFTFMTALRPRHTHTYTHAYKDTDSLIFMISVVSNFKIDLLSVYNGKLQNVQSIFSAFLRISLKLIVKSFMTSHPNQSFLMKQKFQIAFLHFVKKKNHTGIFDKFVFFIRN